MQIHTYALSLCLSPLPLSHVHTHTHTHTHTLTEHTAPSGSSSSRRRNKHDLPPSAGAMSQPDSLHYSISLPPSSMSSHRHSKKRHSPSSSSHPRSLGELDNGSGMPTTQFGSSSRFQRSPPGIGKPNAN